MADRAAVRRAARWAIPAVLVLAVVAWFAVRAGTATGAETDRYATTTVTTGPVTQTYAGSGTVTQVEEATATFPVSATVTRVDVAVGDKVEAGDALASIDDSALETAELEAEQTLADAQVALEGAQDAADASASATASPTASGSASRSSSDTPTRSATSTPSPTTAATSGTGDAGAPPGGTGGTGGGGPGSLPAASLPTLATNVVEAQAALTRIEHTAALQLAAQQKACTPLSVTPSPSGSASASGSTSPSSSATATSTAPTGSASATASASPSGTTTPTPSATPTSTSSATPVETPTPSPVASVDAKTLARCIAAVVVLQQTQQADAARRTAYDTAVNALVTAASGNSQGSTPGSGSGSDSSGSSGGAGSGGGAASGPSAGSGSEGAAGTGSTGPSSGSSAQSSTAGASRTGGTTTVASAEAAVTKARLALDSAQAQLEAATMTAPISGTVAAVPFARGDTASTTDGVTIVGAGAVSVQMAVPEASFRLLKVGQVATLTTPGGGAATGKVTRRGLLPDASTTTTTYPVTVTASGKAARTLPTGASASLAVTVAQATGATVIPVSALTRSGSTGTVQVLANGSVARTQVTLGVVGTSTVQVIDGLAPGQVLVLADTTTPLPTTSADQGNRAFAGGGAGGPGAGGAPPGGR